MVEAVRIKCLYGFLLFRKLADEGEPPVLLLATRGDAGKKNGRVSHLTNEELGALREEEMKQAAEILGLAAVDQIGLPDGGLNQAEPELFVRIIEGMNRL
jgi:LmbE family N-acetylglucosaminyl deacetylase